jgi:prolyl 4-hydroxylase
MIDTGFAMGEDPLLPFPFRAGKGKSEAEAAHDLAIRAAVGAGVAQDWSAAVDHLQRAAELGLPLAQAEFAALAGDWRLSREIAAGEPTTFSDWASLRRQIDLVAWLAAPRLQIASVSPRVAMVEGFAAPEICDWLIQRAQPRLSPAKVYDHDTGGARSEGVRTNSECHFSTDESDLLLLFLRARMERVTELPMHAMEATAILHYLPGQEFLPHFDFLDTASPGYAKDVAERGQRVLTFLLCLNDDYEGGETEFPVLGKRWKGHKGSALFFWNVEPNGMPDRRTVHAGLPPTRGEKWLLSQWMRGPAVQT